MKKQCDCPLCGYDSNSMTVVVDEKALQEMPETEAYVCAACNIYWPTEAQFCK